MGPLWYMRSVVARKVVTRRMTVPHVWVVVNWKSEAVLSFSTNLGRFSWCSCVSTPLIPDLLQYIPVHGPHFKKQFCIVQRTDLILWELPLLQCRIPPSKAVTSSSIYLWFPRSSDQLCIIQDTVREEASSIVFWSSGGSSSVCCDVGSRAMSMTGSWVTDWRRYRWRLRYASSKTHWMCVYIEYLVAQYRIAQSV
jgi:hypothetical protein